MPTGVRRLTRDVIMTDDDDAIQAVKKLHGKLSKSNMEDRTIVSTPIRGNYGKVSHWILTVRGRSPPGHVMVDVEFPDNTPIYIDSGKQRRIQKEDELAVLREFRRKCLAGIEQPQEF